MRRQIEAAMERRGHYCDDLGLVDLDGLIGYVLETPPAQ